MNIMHISAAPGDPSTFWQGASGRWYRTKALAESDIQGNAENPEDYRIEKTFLDKHGKIILIGLLIVGLIAGTGYYLYKNKTLIIKTK